MPTVAPDSLCQAAALLRRRFPGVAAVYVFGTAASDTLRSDSDVDLAMECGEPVSTEQRFEAAQECAKLFGREVDLVDLRQTPLPLQARVVAEGRRLFVANPAEWAFVENAILPRYCAFVEERRPLVETVVRRGSLHA